MKLKMMMDRYPSAAVLVTSGRKVSGAMEPANPLVQANQMPSTPTDTATSTFRMAPPFKIHSESDTFEKLMNTTTHTNAISMPSVSQMFASMSAPKIMPRMGGNSVARLAIHRGKLIQ